MRLGEGSGVRAGAPQGVSYRVLSVHAATEEFVTEWVFFPSLFLQGGWKGLGFGGKEGGGVK